MAATRITRGLVSHKETLLSKFRGAMVGAVVGDCLGAYYEGEWNVRVPAVLTFFSGLRDKEESKKTRLAEHYEQDEKTLHEFTDDTAMARSVAESLIDRQGLDIKDMAKRFVEEFHSEPRRGYGANVGRVFNTLKEEECNNPHGPAKRQFDGQGSYGNGGSMRIAPAALYGYHHSMGDLNALVQGCTLITHSHKQAIIGAQLQCAAVQMALQHDGDLPDHCDQFIDRLHTWMMDLEKDEADETASPQPKRREKRKSEEGPRPYSNKLKLIQEFLKQQDIPRSEIEQTLGNDISALGSAPTALYCFLRCMKPVPDIKVDNPLERTIIYAITLGGDTDTIASMAGAIAGAYYGIGKVPELWQQTCEGVQDAIRQADQLYKLVGRNLIKHRKTSI